MEQEPQKIRLSLSPQAQRYARRDAPLEARLMAARGALPLPPLELATVMFALLHDPDPEVKSTAADSLAALPDPIAQAVLSGPAHPALISHLGHVHANSEAHLERIALNPATDDATIARLARSPFKKIVDIVSHNQERMLRAPEIVEALGSNPLTGRSVIDRILAFLGETGVAEVEGDRNPDSIGDDEAEAALRAVLGDELATLARSLVEETDDELDEAARGNLYALIQQLSIFQKIKLARLVNKEARSLLVRDRNKIVALAAATSPKITENEVIAIAQSRNVGEDVLRYISMNRTWTRGYQIKLALVANPKCPQVTALRFLNYLQERDLRALMRSKDIPQAVSTHARRNLMKKGKL